MVLAETPFRALLQTELRPFRNLLLAFFFLKVGMLLQPAAMMAQAGLIIALTLGLVLLKAGIIAGLMHAFKRPKPQIIELSTLLSQGSEFAFVIFSMGSVQAGLGGELAGPLITAVALSMLLTPLINIFTYRWSLWTCEQTKGIANCPYSGSMNPFENTPVFIVGMNDVGQTLARGFQAHNVPYVAIARDRQRFMEATAAGYTVAYGQPEDLRFWGTLGVGAGRAICVAAPHYETAKALSPIIQKLYPRLRRYVAVQDSAEGVMFAALGMTPFHNRGAPPGLEMACFVLRELGIDDDKVSAWSELEQSVFLQNHDHTEGLAGQNAPPENDDVESHYPLPQNDSGVSGSDNTTRTGS
ncbi:MAG: NAD-binding protein [Alphaproteobacteria bacterium]|nr:NAD-binding protein [Alphaproteobacteria bacterium]